MKCCSRAKRSEFTPPPSVYRLINVSLISYVIHYLLDAVYNKHNRCMNILYNVR